MLKDLFDNIIDFDEVKENIEKNNIPLAVTGIPDCAKGVLGAFLLEKTNEKGLFIAKDEKSALKLYEDILSIFGEGVYYLAAKELVIMQVESASFEYESTRMNVISKMISGDYKAVVTYPDALLTYVSEIDEKNKAFVLKTGEEENTQKLIERLLDMGYKYSDIVEGPGQFSKRGGIFDIFSPSSKNPVRIDFFGDEIDVMGLFDVSSQRRSENIRKYEITPVFETVLDSAQRKSLIKKLSKLIDKYENRPAMEKVCQKLSADIEKLSDGQSLPHIYKYINLLYEKPKTVFDLFEGFIFPCESIGISDRLTNYYKLFREDMKLFSSQGEFIKDFGDIILDEDRFYSYFKSTKTVYMDNFVASSYKSPLKAMVNIDIPTVSGFAGNMDNLIEDLQYYTKTGYKTIIFLDNQRKVQNIKNTLVSKEIMATQKYEALTPKTPLIAEGVLSGGFQLLKSKLVVITEKNQHIKSKRKKKNKNHIQSFSDITPGDYITHENYGVGVYKGVEKLTVGGITKDYFKIQYAGTDTLFVPCNQLEMISKFQSFDSDVKVKLNKLSGTSWNQTKQRAKTAAKDLAKELIELYSKRQNTKGFAFSPDTPWQSEFEDKFSFEETYDQLRCISEIKKDMERPVPMERLLCGDVGFGKTEVALRAAFKAVMDSKQVAVLVPTTILALQHYNTLMSRFYSYPVKIQFLSRQKTKKEQELILRQLARGEIDILVGTHRIIQKDIKFKDLGLLIIDEEQRFGVSHKESLKKLSSNVDVLTLSATPIPRTLNMALSGILDMSVIEEAPGDRSPVNTYVLEHDMGILCDAIKRELSRGGQVFYLHNRIDTLDFTAARIREKVDGNIVIAHGKMSAQELSKIWEQMVEGEIDVLVCTTIIETGVDIPNANTLIIENADCMGLSQLHQIRGRVGRSSRRAYAYLTFKRGKVLNETSYKRLNAIKEFTQFGSGFKIAMRDLEIRGAGNLLGAQQHGYMESVGYDLYMKLIENAVREEKGEKINKLDTIISLDVSEHIPENYIKNEEIRIEIYKKIANITSKEDFDDLYDELLDRFSDIPKTVENLMKISMIRNRASLLGISEIKQNENIIIFYIDEFAYEKMIAIMPQNKGRIFFSDGNRPYVSIKLKKGEGVISLAYNIICQLENADVENSKQKKQVD